MEIRFLNKSTAFPDPLTADQSGLLAVGGTLTATRLLDAYSKGIFPWYSEGEPVMWWSPDPRVVLFPENLHVSRKMKKHLQKKTFTVTVNRQFERIISKCGAPRKDEERTWITAEMIESYTRLHHEGFAHSVEVWKGGELAGGLYGVGFSHMFFGESMFSEIPDSSKFGFIRLTRYLKRNGFLFIDCQIDSGHLRSLGAVPVSREKFLGMLSGQLAGTGLVRTRFPDTI